ncbi:hypothetical protein ACFMPD_15180 [Sedimentitalea sp. HM32M-2]|uniref:hypothetical protein n=1 Tax=Sedimentitalea sp. HM32M-2 TaxID=3351566 RepID=UPI003635C46F
MPTNAAATRRASISLARPAPVAALISWSVYPVVIAGTISVIFGLFRVLQSRVGGVENLTSIGAALPFLAVVLISLGMILSIPVIVRTLTGDMNSGWAASAVGTAQSLQRMQDRAARFRK